MLLTTYWRLQKDCEWIGDTNYNWMKLSLSAIMTGSRGHANFAYNKLTKVRQVYVSQLLSQLVTAHGRIELPGFPWIIYHIYFKNTRVDGAITI